MKLKPGLILSGIDGQHVAVPTGELSRQFRGMITLNDTGLKLWEALRRGTDEAELIKLLCERYEVDEARARADVTAFLARLRDAGVLEEPWATSL